MARQPQWGELLTEVEPILIMIKFRFSERATKNLPKVRNFKYRIVGSSNVPYQSKNELFLTRSVHKDQKSPSKAI